MAFSSPLSQPEKRAQYPCNRNIPTIYPPAADTVSSLGRGALASAQPPVSIQLQQQQRSCLRSALAEAPPPVASVSLLHSSSSASRPKLRHQQTQCHSAAYAVPPLGRGSLAPVQPGQSASSGSDQPCLSARRTCSFVSRPRLCRRDQATPPATAAAAAPLRRTCSSASWPRLRHQ